MKDRIGTETSSHEMRRMLEDLFSCQVFELHWEEREDGKRDALIPYMMNDAVECYFILKDCRMTGQFQEELQEESVCTFLEHGMIVKQGEQNTFSLWFEEMELRKEFYQYHRIGHFWRTGQEQWRRIVYILGTVADKEEYLGEEALNEREQEWKDLIFFPPLRAYSPIRESLEEKYPMKKEAVSAMLCLAREAGDLAFYRLTACYGFFPCSLLARLLTRRLNSEKRIPLYRLLNQKIQEASLCYPQRSYPEEVRKEIGRLRRETEEDLREQGFCGQYPAFIKGETEILAMEEHPFTVMEDQEYGFRIRLMISQSEDRSGGDCGFFRGKRRKGWIS